MKSKLNIFYLIALTFVIYSCSKSSNERPIGQWDDIINLSAKDVAFKSTADSTTIKTQGDWWWITGVTVDKNDFSNFQGVDVLSDHYVIEEDCFVVERFGYASVVD